MQKNHVQNRPHIFVVGNEKGGAGKTTCSMHLIIGLMDRGYKVASIDTDSRQHSITTYINNRIKYNQDNPGSTVMLPVHFHIQDYSSRYDTVSEREDKDKEEFQKILDNISSDIEYLVIDTPGSNTYLSRLAHSHADTVITPINDSFIDLDVLAKVNGSNLDITKPSIYSQMLWEQKMERASRDRGCIKWVVVRNRLSNIDSRNKRNIADAISKLSKRINFQIAPGFSERVIFRELFLHGLTLLDLTKTNFTKTFSMSHVAARQELRDFLDAVTK